MAHAPASEFKNPVVNWIDSRLPVFTMIKKEYGVFPTPRNFNYFWNFGAIALFVLVTMIVTGVVLAMHYTPNDKLAFNSVERIMRDVNWGWLLRYIHMNGASMFFVAVYIHMARGLYYGSYKQPRELLWIIGAAIYLAMMATAFMGYVLPWGQMSFWGATVITNFFTAIPVFGNDITTWLLGGFAVGNPTLNRFFSLHYLLPFVIAALVFLHVAALHVSGSNNPLGIEPKGPQDTIPFHPYYTTKDSFGLTLFVILWALMVFYAPNMLGDPENYTPANPLVTPTEIVPEWYFLPFYAILRSITFTISLPFTDVVLINSKLGGVLAMGLSILMLFILPWLDTSPVRSARFRPIFRITFWILIVGWVMLTYAGGKPAAQPYLTIGQIGTLIYFAFFLSLPFIARIEKPLPMPPSIAAAVLGGGSVAAGATAKPMEKA
jgi:ubiquinol-cytochrome c reductase cytochrome b/c1 subunit